MHIVVYCDKVEKGSRNNLPLCCSTIPFNTFVPGNNSVSSVLQEFDLQFYKIMHV